MQDARGSYEQCEERVDELLRAARERLAFGWAQGTVLQNLQGEPTSDPAEAAHFCVLGAFAHASYSLRSDARTYYQALERLSAVVAPADDGAAPAWTIPAWNDAAERTRADVLAAFDAALAGAASAEPAPAKARS